METSRPLNGGAVPLGTPAHYNGIIFGNATAVQADCEGALAVGGNAKLGSVGNGFDIGVAGVAGWESVMVGKYENPNGYPTFLLGGRVSDGSTTCNVYTGGVVMKAGYQLAYEKGAFRFQASPVGYTGDGLVEEFFAAAKIQVQSIAAALAAAGQKKIPLSALANLRALDPGQYGAKGLCTDKKVLVYSIDCKPTDTINIGEIGLGSYIKNYDTIVIDAPARKVTFSGGAILYDGAIIDTSLPRIYPGNALNALVASKLVFNFPGATAVGMAHYGVIGSVLAPKAAVTATGGSLNGMLVADSFYQDNGMQLHAFKISLGDGIWDLVCPPPTGSVTIQKQDKDTRAALPGAKFTLFAYSEGEYTPVATGETDRGGLLTFGGLPPGRYRLKETAPPWGYILPEHTEWTFDLTENNEGEVPQLDIIYIKNTLAKGGVTIIKTDYDNEAARLPNAVFSLYVYDEEGGAYSLVRENLLTGPDGALTLDELVPGRYRLVETQAPDGYYLSRNGTVEFVVELDGSGSIVPLEDIEIRNQLLASLEVLKRDAADAQSALQGAVFSLYQRDGATGEYKEISTGWTTDENGRVVIGGLRPGDYRLVETQAPQGYYLPADAAVEFKVETDGDDRIIKLDPLSITNQMLGKVQFYKIDSENEKLYLEGAMFVLYKQNESGVYVEYRTGLQSGADGGLLLEDLEPGNYKLVETKSPRGYLLPENPGKEFTIVL